MLCVACDVWYMRCMHRNWPKGPFSIHDGRTINIVKSLMKSLPIKTGVSFRCAPRQMHFASEFLPELKAKRMCQEPRDCQPTARHPMHSVLFQIHLMQTYSTYNKLKDERNFSWIRILGAPNMKKEEAKERKKIQLHFSFFGKRQNVQCACILFIQNTFTVVAYNFCHVFFSSVGSCTCHRCDVHVPCHASWHVRAFNELRITPIYRSHITSMKIVAEMKKQSHTHKQKHMHK